MWDANPGRLQLNTSELVMQAVMGQIAHPVGHGNPYRIGQDGVARVLPGTGGIVINCRIGDRCVGLAADHVEPGVALHNNGHEIIGPRNGPNLALLTSACVGNHARVATGPATGATGLVTGKHGGVDHVLVDFDTRTLRRLNIGDKIQVYSCGLGLSISDFPQITVMNCGPSLLRRWAPRTLDDVLQVRVTHILPAAIIGSGLGKNNAWRGDFDIQLFDAPTRRRYRLDTLRFGDLVAGPGQRYPLWGGLAQRAHHDWCSCSQRQHSKRTRSRRDRSADRFCWMPAAYSRQRCQYRRSVWTPIIGGTIHALAVGRP